MNFEGAKPNPNDDSSLLPPHVKLEIKKVQDAPPSVSGTLIDQAETRTMQANLRTDAANARTDEANTRTDQANSRTEQADFRTKRAEMRSSLLRASELSYRRLFESARDGILILELATGRVTDVNPYLVELLGFSHGEMVGKTVGELSPFKDAVANLAMLDRLQTEGYVRYEDLPLETRDGRKIAVEFVSNVYQAGEIKVIQCNIRDITVRKLTEAALRESEEQYRAVMETSPDGIFVLLQNRFVLVNPSGLKLFGATRQDELLGRDAYELIHPDFHDIVRSRMAEAARHSGALPLVEEKILRLDGSVVDVEASSTQISFHGRVALLVELRDITERKRLEANLREEQALYHSLVEQLPAGVFRKDLAGRYVFINPWFCRLKGIAAEAILGKMPLDLAKLELLGHQPEISANAWAAKMAVQGEDHHQAIIRTGIPIEVEEIYPGTNGMKRHFHVVKSPVFDANGKIAGSQGILFEVSELRQTAIALQAEQSMFQSLATTVPDRIYFKDRQSRFVRVNEALVQMFSLHSAAEVVGKTDFDFHGQEHAQQSYEDEQRVMLTGEPLIGCEEKEAWPDGRITWSSSTKVALRDADGIITGLVGISRDITERKQAEESHNRLAIAVEQASESIVITDTNGAILYTNPAFEKSTGYKRAEVFGQNPRVLKSGKQGVEFYRQMWEVLKRGEVWTGHFVNRRKDGTLYEEDATISPIRDPAGEIVSYVAVKRDVSREVQLEAQFRQAQKMEAIGTLAGGVAHDFNNILAVIQMQAELLRGGGGLSAEQESFAIEIGITVQRAAALTRQLLVFSRREALHPRELDLSESITSTTKMLRRILGETIEVQLKLAAQPLVVHADPSMIDQVLMNLAVNARDAMLNGGKVVIETSGVEFDQVSAAQSASARPGSFVCLSVSDTGIGIPPEVLPRIFEPFFTTKDVGKGTGLGLATVFGIAQQHHGWISVQSEVDFGTTFRIFLPRVAKSAATPGSQPDQAAPCGGNETILLVEDEQALRGSVSKLLSRLGYRVLEAPSGVKALEVWKEHRDEINLLLTDLVMPDGMSGKDLAECLLQEASGLKVIYMSGYSAEVAGKNLPLTEGDNFLSKPFEVHKFARAIRNCLDKHTS